MYVFQFDMSFEDYGAPHEEDDSGALELADLVRNSFNFPTNKNSFSFLLYIPLS